MADPVEVSIQAILDKYEEITSTRTGYDDGEELPLVFGNKARDQHAAHPRISWVETGGTIDPGRGGSGDEEPERASMWSRLDVEVWRDTVENARNCALNLIAAAANAIDAVDLRWTGFRRDEERHKDDGVVFVLEMQIRIPVPLDGTRGKQTAQVLHHTGTYSPDTSVGVAGDAYEQLAWVADNSGETARLHGFTAEQLEESATAAAARVVTVTTGDIGTRTLTGCIVGASGYLWTWTSGTEPAYVFRLTPAQLLTTASVTPGIILTLPTSGDASTVVRCRFDRGGNLWVLTAGNYLWKIDAADLGASGTPTPSVAIQFAGHGDGTPADFLFDQAGNMLVSFNGGDESTASAILKVTPAEYAASNAALEPAVIIGGTDTGNRRGYGGLALATDGKVWVTSRPVGDIENDRLLAYAPAQFNASANDPPPFYQLFPTWEGDINSPLGVEFDQSGHLWFTGGGAADLNRVPVTKLKASGSVTPDIILTASVAGASRFAFQTLAL